MLIRSFGQLNSLQNLCAEDLQTGRLWMATALLWGSLSFSGQEPYFYIFCVSAAKQMGKKMLNSDAGEIKGRKIIYRTEEEC